MTPFQNECILWERFLLEETLSSKIDVIRTVNDLDFLPKEIGALILKYSGMEDQIQEMVAQREGQMPWFVVHYPYGPGTVEMLEIHRKTTYIQIQREPIRSFMMIVVHGTAQMSLNRKALRFNLVTQTFTDCERAVCPLI